MRHAVVTGTPHNIDAKDIPFLITHIFTEEKRKGIRKSNS
jgi:hypothetical protein